MKRKIKKIMAGTFLGATLSLTSLSMVPTIYAKDNDILIEHSDNSIYDVLTSKELDRKNSSDEKDCIYNAIESVNISLEDYLDYNYESLKKYKNLKEVVIRSDDFDGKLDELDDVVNNYLLHNLEKSIPIYIENWNLIITNFNEEKIEKIFKNLNVHISEKQVDCYVDDLSCLNKIVINNDELILNIFAESIQASKNNIDVLKKLKNNSTVNFYSVYVDNNLLDYIKDIYSVGFLDYNISNLDLSRLKGVSNICLNESAYNVPLYMNSRDYTELKNSGTSILNSTQADKNSEENKKFVKKIVELNEKLDRIYSHLNINENMSDEEKIKYITMYIIDNFQYDEEVNKDPEDDYVNSFYEDGILYGSLEKKSQICGNYAGMFCALANRAGIESYYICTNEHAWNLVKCNNEYFYLDTTWMDGKKVFFKEISGEKMFEYIEKNKGEYDMWYLKTPGQMESHNAKLPPWINIDKSIKSNNASKSQKSSKGMYVIEVSAGLFILLLGNKLLKNDNRKKIY